jgi:ankyrin repeat protein
VYSPDERCVHEADHTLAAVPKARNKEGSTPLACAAANGHLPAARLLVESGANIEVTTNSGLTPLFLAVQHHRHSITEYLLSVGAVVDCLADGHTPLYHSCSVGDCLMVETLLSTGAANINYRSPSAQLTCLHIAVLRNQLRMVQLLIACPGVQLEARDSLQNTPLYHACKDGSLEVAQALVEAGADINSRNEMERTPAFAATAHVPVLEFLVSKGADLSARDRHDWTILHVAVEGGKVEAAEFLCQHGLDVNAKEGLDGWTPLHLVCQGHRQENDTVHAVATMVSAFSFGLADSHGYMLTLMCAATGP